MLEFFKGWKRIAGFVTLVIACVFVMGWIRSLMIADQFMPLKLASIDQCIVFMPDAPTGGSLWISRAVDADMRLFEDPDAEWQVKWFGFGIGTFQRGIGQSFTTWVIPYWAVAIPLALLTGYLLLSKSRPAKQPENPA